MKKSSSKSSTVLMTVSTGGEEDKEKCNGCVLVASLRLYVKHTLLPEGRVRILIVFNIAKQRPESLEIQ